MHPKKCEECESGIHPPAKLRGKLWSREGKKKQNVEIGKFKLHQVKVFYRNPL